MIKKIQDLNWCKLLGWFDPCNHKQKIKSIKTVMKHLVKQIHNKDENINQLNQQIQLLKKEINKLKQQNQDKQEQELDELEKYRKQWNNNHPKAYITYKGRYVPQSNTRMKIPVQLYIDTNDPVIKLNIEANELQVKNPLNCDDKILEIYKHTRTKPTNPYRYLSDSKNIGVPELWLFTHELRYAERGDCDDWGNELVSYLISAGVPRFRVRCVAGHTWGGGGHLTVYVLQDDMETWRHINSTTSYHHLKDKDSLNDFPTSNDSEDEIGIKNVWFSYNDKYSWHEFETRTAEKSYKKHKDLFDINPIKR